MMSVLTDDGYLYIRQIYWNVFIEIFKSAILGTWVNNCLYIASCKEDYDAKWYLVYFHPPVEETKC
jgi:hypothetical protein